MFKKGKNQAIRAFQLIDPMRVDICIIPFRIFYSVYVCKVRIGPYSWHSNSIVMGKLSIKIWIRILSWHICSYASFHLFNLNKLLTNSLRIINLAKRRKRKITVPKLPDQPILQKIHIKQCVCKVYRTYNFTIIAQNSFLPKFYEENL